MSERFTEVFRKLAAQAEQVSSVLVSYSGGKDSLAVLDLCSRCFSRVVCFHYYFVPGLAVVEKQLDIARERYKAEILLYPGRMLIDSLIHGIYRWRWEKGRRTIQAGLNIETIVELVRADTGIRLLATGARFADGLGQGLTHKVAERDGKSDPDWILPIAKWNKWDVLAYLKNRDIPVPESDGRNSSSVDLSTPCLLWLHDKHPEDFEKVCKVFPFARSVIKRRDWYGVE